jgi:transcriptional regulator GlxA family with amidase domain
MKKAFFICFIFLIYNSVLVAQKQDSAYFCPPCNSHCDEISFDKGGKCSHCGMILIKQSIAERKKQMSEKKYSIGLYLQDGVEVLDFAGPLEVFSYAGFDIYIISKTKNTIVSQGILKITPDYDITDAPPTDILAFFGGNAGVASNDPDVINWINNRKSTTEYHFSVCTGAFIMGKAGILDDKTATTFHLSIEDLKTAFPKSKVLSDVRFVDNGKVITTAGISAGIDGALYLVSKLKGEQAAKDIAKYMEYDKWIPNQGLILTEKK